jgi:hypothetical protein
LLLPLQTKELIAEIELLEEEIANREQHVLTLYRSIFDQCVSGPSSGQSSGISSPAHAKSVSSRARRRQSSIISSAFCSSKKLPLQPFHIMTTVSESGRTKNMLKTKIRHESFSSESLDIRPTSLASDPRKVRHTNTQTVLNAFNLIYLNHCRRMSFVSLNPRGLGVHSTCRFF